ncbi:transcriptional regulator [Cohnella kolymensis]|uniref:Transcriptional regulator n=1 Tax=Cohnella kolymensis TaxID=1590652 RepID=A0ABR5A8U3_9BACL|nr:LacI family DNA-binding transcriptional regulator [Cohnella kolymensis]KIL37484.1 transcriptional regulator [Cohnella kolymensis]
MKITIVEVAKRAGVSKTTVSRILNGNFGNATEETVMRVQRVIQELDYRPNSLAQGLKQVKTKVIGIILSNLLNPFWMRVLEGVEDTCRSRGYSLMICNSNDDPAIEEEHIRSFRLRQVDGIIINPTAVNSPLFQSLIGDRYPIVTINRKITDLAIDSVVMNNVSGAQAAVEHLIAQGRKRVAFLVYPMQGVSPRVERFEGYKKALSNHGIEIQAEMFHEIEEKKGEVQKLVKHLLTSENRPDAIFSTNNMMSLEVLAAIKETGLRIPQDIALVGYDETVWSQHLNPPLTTVRQPAMQMGQLATERIIELINSTEIKEPQMTVLEPELIIRESSSGTALAT